MPRRKLTPTQKQDRKLTLYISMFLLNQDDLKNLFWEVKTVEYNHISQKIKIGIDSTHGKYGTTLASLRKHTKELSNHLFENGITFRPAKITFFINKEEESIHKIYSILDGVENVK